MVLKLGIWSSTAKGFVSSNEHTNRGSLPLCKAGIQAREVFGAKHECNERSFKHGSSRHQFLVGDHHAEKRSLSCLQEGLSKVPFAAEERGSVCHKGPVRPGTISYRGRTAQYHGTCGKETGNKKENP